MLSATAVGCVFAAGEASAQTLQQALTQAYEANPDLQAARASQRALDENYVQARAGFGPQVNATLAGQYTKSQGSVLGIPTNIENDSGNGTVSLDQPLYTGGRVTAQVQQALRDIEAGRERLRIIEAQVMLATIQAYSNVRRDQQALAIRQETLQAYRDQVTEITRRMQEGELTRTDVAQVQFLLENEQSQVANAQAQLQASRAAYRAVVGQYPETLEPESMLPGLPATLEQALQTAAATNPAVREAFALEQSSREGVNAARAAFLPNIGFRASLGYVGPLEPFETDLYDRGFTGTLTVTQPLFSAGVRQSFVRQARALNDSDKNAIVGAERIMVQNVTDSWNQMTTARGNAASSTAAVRTARVVLEGTQIEYRADFRSTYEVLNARERLAAAQLFLLDTQQQEFLASARLLASIGKLEAANLVSGVKTYDPTVNFDDVKNSGALPTDYIARLLDSLPIIKPAE